MSISLWTTTSIVLTVILILLFFIFIFIYLNQKNKYEKNISIISEKKIEDFTEKKILFLDNNFNVIYIKGFNDKRVMRIIGENIFKHNFPKDKSKGIVNFLDNNKYQYYFHNESKTITLEDTDDKQIFEKQLKNREVSIMIVKVEFSSKLRIDETKKFNSMIKINEYLTEWSNNNDSLVRLNSFNFDNITILSIWSKIEKDIISNNFFSGLLKAFDVKETSISIGMSVGGNNLIKNETNALRTLSIAERRGGNQIVLNYRNQLKFIGKSNQNKNDDSNVKLRLFYNNLMESIKYSSEIFISTHINSDADSLASCFAMLEILNKRNKNVYVVLETYDDFTLKLMKDLPINSKINFINENEALKMLSNSSMLILLDLSDFERSQAKRLYKEIDKNNIYVIDHHRISMNSKLELDSNNVYVNTNISSASEIVTNFLMFNDEIEDNKILETKAFSFLMYGIYSDTSGMVKNTSESTYIAMRYLSKEGGSLNEFSIYNKNSNEFMDVISKYLNKIQIFNKNIAVLFIPENEKVSEITISKISDFLLETEDIYISLVLGNIDKKYKLSARSVGNYNVQIFMERIGGGGHFNSSANIWKEETISYDEVQNIILNNLQEINKYNIRDKEEKNEE